MNKKFLSLLAIVLSLSLVFAGCANEEQNIEGDGKLKVVATTTMLADLVSIIGADRVSVEGLMGPGVDPHLYQASAGDVTRLQEADVVVYNGLHLEGKMGDIFNALGERNGAVICIEDGLDSTKLLEWEEEESVHDPHIWFDVSLWMEAAKHLTSNLKEIDADNADAYETNLNAYLKELEELDAYIKDRIAEVPEESRVLITAHDAFSYFGQAYNFEVRGLQGISTEAEAGTADVSDLASFIAENQIKAIFVESSVPTKTIEALQAAVQAQGFDVEIGGELYSDSLGGEGSGAQTYILTFKANIDTIVDALK